MGSALETGACWEGELSSRGREFSGGHVLEVRCSKLCLGGHAREIMDGMSCLVSHVRKVMLGKSYLGGRS